MAASLQRMTIAFQESRASSRSPQMCDAEGESDETIVLLSLLAWSSGAMQRGGRKKLARLIVWCIKPSTTSAK